MMNASTFTCTCMSNSVEFLSSTNMVVKVHHRALRHVGGDVQKVQSCNSWPRGFPIPVCNDSKPTHTFVHVYVVANM